MNITIYLRTWWRGKLAGTDLQGNRYYEDKKPDHAGKRRRWVLYRGYPEASRVPSGWHGWLHYSAAAAPVLAKNHAWEKEHQPNLTGTTQAYKPSGIESDILVKDYEAWVPPEN